MLYVASATDVAAINVEQAGTSPQATPRWTFAWAPLLEVMTDGSAVQTGSNSNEMTGLVFNPALDLLYLAAVSNRNVYALDASTGRQVWVWTSPWFFNNAQNVLSLGEGRLFIQGANFHLYALNATTGALLWDSSVPRRWSVLTLPAGDLVLHTDATRNTFAFNAASGNLSWIFRQDRSREYKFDQGVYDSNTRMLYVSDDASHMYSIDVRQGFLAWDVNIGEALQAGDDTLRQYMGIAGGVLYTHNFHISTWVPGKERVSALSAWNASSGALLWTRPLQPSLVRFEVLEPLGAVLLATIPPASPPADVIKTRLWLVDFQGNTRWTADLGGTARSPRIISERLIPDLQRQAFYFVDSKGFLVAMAMATGLPGSDLCIHLDISSKEPPGPAGDAPVVLPCSPPFQEPTLPPPPPAAPASPAADEEPPLCWRSPSVNSLPLSTPAVENGLVYCSDGLLFVAVNASTGDTVWRQWGGQGLVEPLNPVVADGRAFFGSAGQRVHAYDAKTGRVLWLFDSGAGAGTSAALWRTPGFGPQGAYAGGMLFYGGGDNAWWSLNATDGSPVWTYRLEDMDFTAASSVAVHDGILYATATPFYSTVKPRATRILALDARTGEEVWSRTMLGAVTETELGELLVEPELGAVVVGTDDGTLQAYSLGPDGGDLLWALRTSTASIWAALYHEGVVYAADMQGMVHAVRVSGDSQEVLWSADLRPVVARLVPIPVSTVTMFRPQTLYGKLYVPTNQGLAVMNASSGAVLWTDGMYNRIGRGLTLVEHPPDPADPYGKPVVQVLYAQYFNYLVSMTDACGVPWTGGDDTAPTSSPPPPPSAPPTPLVPPSCPPCPNNTACGGFEGTGGSITQPRLTQTLSLGLTGVPYSVVTSRGGRAAVLRSLREALGSSGAGGRAELVWRSAARADAPRDVYGGVVVKVELRAGSAGLLSDCQTSLEGAVLEGRLEEGLRRALRGLAQTAPVLAPAVRVRSLMALG